MKGSSNLASFWVPLKIMDTASGKLLWENEVPNSPFHCRPHLLIRTKETYETVAKYFKNPLQKIGEMNKGSVINKDDIKISCQTVCSMIDGKMCALLGGDGCAFCHLCTWKKDHANDLLKIQGGFLINRSAEEQAEIWSKLQS